METDGFLNEFSFQCHNHFFERREGASDKMMQWSNLWTRTDGMVAGNKSSPANSNNGLPRNEREKGASFRLPPPSPKHHQPAPSDHIENPRKAAYISLPHEHSGGGKALSSSPADHVHAFTTIRLKDIYCILCPLFQ